MKNIRILGLYKFKHHMTCNRGPLAIKGSLNLFVHSGVIEGVFTTDENESMTKSFPKSCIADLIGQGDVQTFRQS